MYGALVRRFYVLTSLSVLFCLFSLIYCFFFFFSSRRRHTRCLSDWSSDVCSSDLPIDPGGEHGLYGVWDAEGGMLAVVLPNCPRQLLQKERITRCLPDNFLLQARRELLGLRPRLHEHQAIVGSQPWQGKLRRIGVLQ